MRYLSVCSGIEAASCAWEGLGWELAGLAEIEPFASAVLDEHYPGKNLGDFTKIDVTSLGRIDLLVGGTPCQDFSQNGKRAGFAGANGRLTLAFTDLVDELEKHCGLRYVVWENVPAILSHKRNPFGAFLGRLLGADGAVGCPTGDGSWPRAGVASGARRSAVWRVLDAQFFGTPQRRERIFLVLCLGAGPGTAAKLLLEPGGAFDAVEQSRERRRRDLVRRHCAGDLDLPRGRKDRVGPGHGPRRTVRRAWAYNGDGRVSHVAHTILTTDASKSDVGVIQEGVPRKYLAVERERLQGFPDGWTDVEFRGEPATRAMRTSALGNAMPVTVMNWIGERIAAHDAGCSPGSVAVPNRGTPQTLDEPAIEALEFLLSPRLHRILFALLASPGQQFTLADLFRIAGPGRGATQDIVQRLLASKLFRERREGRARLIHADWAHPLVADLRALLAKARFVDEARPEIFEPLEEIRVTRRRIYSSRTLRAIMARAVARRDQADSLSSPTPS